MKKALISTLACLGISLASLAQDPLLTGTPFGSTAVDYSNGQSSTTVNTVANAFDGNLNTYFASYNRTYTYAALDLGSPYIITRVAWSPRNDGVGPSRTKLAVFEGANQPDFMDAIPLYITDVDGVIGQYQSADINCSKGFRYVRYVGPNDSRCNVAEVQFYGHSGVGDNSQLPQIGGLPTVVIHTVNAQDPYDKEHEIVSIVSIVQANEIMTDSAGVRLRGNASMGFPKKPYRIKFYKKKNVLGSPAKAKKWCLINNYGDKTLMRNLIAYEYARRLNMAYVPFSHPVNVFLNGEYKGCYQLADQLEINKNRINITEMAPEDITGEALTGGYHLEMDGYAHEEPENGRFYSYPYNMGITIKEPDSDEITSQQKQYINNHFNTMCQRVQNHNNWRQYLDEDSFLQHFLVGELSANTDTYWSMHMYKNRSNDTIYCGPEWDFDIAFDNDYRHYPTCNKSDYLYKSAGTNQSFVSRIIKDDVAAQRRMTYLWSDARLNHDLCADTICQLIDNWAATLDQSQRLNFLRWPILSSNVHMNPRNAGSYSGEVTFLKNFVRNRFNWMDTHVGLDTTVSTAVEETYANENAPMLIYNLQGLLIGQEIDYQHLASGIYIVKQGSNSTKVLVP